MSTSQIAALAGVAEPSHGGGGAGLAARVAALRLAADDATETAVASEVAARDAADAARSARAAADAAREAAIRNPDANLGLAMVGAEQTAKTAEQQAAAAAATAAADRAAAAQARHAAAAASAPLGDQALQRSLEELERQGRFRKRDQARAEKHKSAWRLRAARQSAQDAARQRRHREGAEGERRLARRDEMAEDRIAGDASRVAELRREADRKEQRDEHRDDQADRRAWSRQDADEKRKRDPEAYRAWRRGEAAQSLALAEQSAAAAQQIIASGFVGASGPGELANGSTAVATAVAAARAAQRSGDRAGYRAARNVAREAARQVAAGARGAAHLARQTARQCERALRKNGGQGDRTTVQSAKDAVAAAKTAAAASKKAADKLDKARAGGNLAKLQAATDEAVAAAKAAATAARIAAAKTKAALASGAPKKEAHPADARGAQGGAAKIGAQPGPQPAPAAAPWPPPPPDDCTGTAPCPPDKSCPEFPGAVCEHCEWEWVESIDPAKAKTPPDAYAPGPPALGPSDYGAAESPPQALASPQDAGPVVAAKPDPCAGLAGVLAELDAEAAVCRAKANVVAGMMQAAFGADAVADAVSRGGARSAVGRALAALRGDASPAAADAAAAGVDPADALVSLIPAVQDAIGCGTALFWHRLNALAPFRDCPGVHLPTTDELALWGGLGAKGGGGAAEPLAEWIREDLLPVAAEALSSSLRTVLRAADVDPLAADAIAAAAADAFLREMRGRIDARFIRKLRATLKNLGAIGDTPLGPLGLVFLGVTPLGPVLDVMDLAQAARELRKNPGWATAIGIAFAAIAFIPGVGDAIAIAGRGIAKNLARAWRWVRAIFGAGAPERQAAERAARTIARGERRLLREAEERAAKAAEHGADAEASRRAAGGVSPDHAAAGAAGDPHATHADAPTPAAPEPPVEPPGGQARGASPPTSGGGAGTTPPSDPPTQGPSDAPPTAPPPGARSGGREAAGKRSPGVRASFTERELDLGRDPASGGKLRMHEVECATELETRVGKLTRSTGQGDWVDAGGRIYDGIGPVPEGGPYTIEQFLDSIDDHLSNPNKNLVQEFVVDVRRLPPGEVARVVDRVEALRALTPRTISIQGR